MPKRIKEAEQWDFGFDHKKKLKFDGIQAALEAQKLRVAADDELLACLTKLERFWALWREREGLNNKDYLNDDFDISGYTIPMMRQVLSQYDIDYEDANASRTDLIRLFNDNLDELKTANGVSGISSCVTQPLTCYRSLLLLLRRPQVQLLSLWQTVSMT